jgi:hypothetical protein
VAVSPLIPALVTVASISARPQDAFELGWISLAARYALAAILLSPMQTIRTSARAEDQDNNAAKARRPASHLVRMIL